MNTKHEWCRHVLIAEPEGSADLAVLLRNRSFLELPWGDSILIEAQLRKIAEAGAQEVEVVVRKASKGLVARLEGGRPWGLVLRVHEHPDPWRLVDDPRMLRTTFPSVTTALVSSLAPNDVEAWFRQTTPALWESENYKRLLATRLDLAAGISAATGMSRVDFPKSITTPRQLLDVNLELLERTPSEVMLLRRISEGVYASRDASIPATSRFSGVNLVDQGALIDPKVESLSNCIISKDAVVGVGTRMDRCLVMPGSSVGANLELQNMIIDGRTIVDLESNTSVCIEDEDLFSSAHSSRSTVGWMERFLAAAMFAMMLIPALLVWAVAWLVGRAVVTYERRFVTSGRALSGEQLWKSIRLPTLEVPGWSWGRRVLWLPFVVKGNFSLRGDRLPPSAPISGWNDDGPRFGVYPPHAKQAIETKPAGEAGRLV